MTTATAPEFPLDTFRDAAEHLRRPFTPQAVKFKVQATWPKENPTGGLVVAYIDARLAVERLNLIVPHLWHDEYAQIDAKHMLCKLTVDGITRQDIGEADGGGKAIFSDALKRAAVKFGIGVSLYAIPKMIIDVGSGQAKPKRSRDGQTLEMTPAGEARVRAIYAKWLDEHGIEAFGKPLSHGDVDGAAGDTETDDQHVAPVESVVPPYGPAYDKEIGPKIGAACTGLTGSADAGKTLVSTLRDLLGGYLPQAAAVALIEADKATMRIPEIEAPEVT